MKNSSYSFKAIGVLRGGGEFPQQAPRQGVYARNEGYIELFPHCNYEQALEDLGGFERIWLLFVFDRNVNWKPKVLPPYGIDRKVGTFASRSPYRPNPVGLSAVELVKIEGLKVYIRNFDLLDGTPILDIKPYIPEVDFTVEIVASTDGVTKKDAEGKLSHFTTAYDSEAGTGNRFGHTVSDCYAIGILRSTSWITEHTTSTDDLGHRFFFTGMNYDQHTTAFSDKAVAGVGLSEEHVALGLPVGTVSTMTLVLDRADDILPRISRSTTASLQRRIFSKRLR